MTTTAYVTESGSVRQPSTRDRQVGWWYAAMVGGHGLGNYRHPDGETRFIIQDWCTHERASLGVSEREVAYWLRSALDGR